MRLHDGGVAPAWSACARYAHAHRPPGRAGIAGAAIYVAVACWAKFSYVDPSPKRAVAIQQRRPFVWETGFAWRVGQVMAEDANRLTDEILRNVRMAEAAARNKWRSIAPAIRR